MSREGRQVGADPCRLRRRPQGALGTITGADRVADGYDVEAAWWGAERRTPWVDRLTQAEYEARLIELP